MRLRDLRDRLPFRSKASRERRAAQGAEASHLQAQRDRQAHYRAVTGTDASGRKDRGSS